MKSTQLLVLIMLWGAVTTASSDTLENVLDGFDKADNSSDALEVLENFDEQEVPAESLEVLDGFDRQPTNLMTEDTVTEKSNMTSIQISGWSKLVGIWNIAHHATEKERTDWRGLSRLRAELLIEMRAKLPYSWQFFASGKAFHDVAYTLNGHDQYSNEVLDNYETELELRELYVSKALNSHIDLKLGRQILVWGRSSNLRVTDILNPLDMRELGLTDIEDLRLPVTMLRLDSYYDVWQFTAVVIPEKRFEKLPIFGHDFYAGQARPPADIKPNNTLSNMEYAAALTGTFSDWDFSLYWAHVYDDKAYVQLQKDEDDTPQLIHNRLKMLGGAGNFVLGNTLLFAEIAHLSGVQFSYLPSEDFSRTDVLIGLEYSGLTNTTLSIEAANQHLHHFNAQAHQAIAKKDSFQWVFRFNRKFLREQLSFTWFALFDGLKGQGGGVQRYQLDYDIASALSVSGGVVLYHGGTHQSFQDIANNDRLFFEIKYSF